MQPVNAQARVGGFVEIENHTYFKNPDPERINGRNQGIVQLELSHQFDDIIDVFGAIEFRNDVADSARNRVFLDEAYVSFFVGDFDVKVGKQVYVWGRADVFNPTDNLTVWDFSDPLDTDDERIGAISLQIRYYVANWIAEVVFVPSFTPSTLPQGNSRWRPELPSDVPNPNFPQQGPPTLPATYIDLPAVLPDQGVDSWQYAAKLTGTLSGWDFSFSWFDGFDDLPAIQTTSTATPDGSADVTLQWSYHRRRAVGVDVATVFGKFGVRGEAAYYITEDWNGTDPAIDDPYLHYSIGVDRSFTNLIGENDLYLLVEWIHDVQVPDRMTTYRLFDLNHVFRKSLAGKADLRLGPFLTVTTEAVWNLYAHDWLVRPGFEWSPLDALQILGQLDFLGGPTDSFFGLLRENDRVRARLKYSF